MESVIINKKEYQLDENSKQMELDGEIYRIVDWPGKPGSWVKILYTNSKEMQLEIQKQIKEGGAGENRPKEFVYRDGAFVGYRFERSEPEEIVYQEPQPLPVERSWEYFSSVYLKVASGVGIAIIVSIIQIFLLHSIYVDAYTKGLGAVMIFVCNFLSWYGRTAAIGGVALLIAASLIFSRINTLVYPLLQLTGCLLGIAAADLLIVILSGIAAVVYWMVAYAIALLPTAITVICVACFIRFTLKNYK